MRKSWITVSVAVILLVACFGAYRYATRPYATRPVDVNIEFAYSADVAGGISGFAGKTANLQSEPFASGTANRFSAAFGNERQQDGGENDDA